MKVVNGECGDCKGDLTFWDFNVGNYCPHCGSQIESFE